MENRFRAVKLLFDTVMVDTGHYTFVKTHRNVQHKEFPGNPVVRIQSFHCYSWGSIPGLGIKILQATWLHQKINIKKKQHNGKPKVKYGL